MSPRRPSSSFSCILTLMLSGFILLVGVGILTASIPGAVEQTFGTASPNLGQVQRARLMLRLLWQRDLLVNPCDPLGQEIPFEVGLGEAPANIAQRLQNQGLIQDEGAWLAYLQYRGLDVTLQAGQYTFNTAQTAIEIAHAMQDATPAAVAFYVLAGWRMEEIAQALPTSGLSVTPEEFLALSRQRPLGYQFSENLPASISAEGFLFPTQYTLERETSATQLLASLLHAFETQVTPELLDGYSAQGLSLYEAVIVASIVEREAILDDEMPLIASVYLNRHAISMKLDADPTVQYALGFNNQQNTWWTNPLSAADLQVLSPYNTYVTAGLPPGPICNPGPAALRAVAFPASSPYFYFRAACDHSGRHVFAETFEQHQGNACPP